MRKFTNMRALILFLSFVALGCAACSSTSSGNGNSRPVNAAANNTKQTPAQPVVYNYEVVNNYKHQEDAFTEGLQFYNGFLYESTGGYKKKDPFSSSVRKVELQSGKVLDKTDLAEEYFGEGLTIMGDKLYQLTWNENTCFVYDLATLKLLKEFKYQGEGWGMTNDGKNIIMTDSTHVIRFFNPDTFELVKTLPVFDAKGQPLMQINELEYIKGEIWANIWQKDTIVRIDPNSGKLLGTIDMTKLVDEAHSKSDKAEVLNGIAYDDTTDRIFVTGKQWKNLYEIKVTPKE
jgi:glutamine cyclotransferase